MLDVHRAHGRSSSRDSSCHVPTTCALLYSVSIFLFFDIASYRHAFAGVLFSFCFIVMYLCIRFMFVFTISFMLYTLIFRLQFYAINIIEYNFLKFE